MRRVSFKRGFSKRLCNRMRFSVDLTIAASSIHAVTGTSNRSNDDDVGSRSATVISDNTVLGSMILFLRQGHQMPSL
jgi:hypothetical protein